jgi:hypothetical protein
MTEILIPLLSFRLACIWNDNRLTQRSSNRQRHPKPKRPIPKAVKLLLLRRAKKCVERGDEGSASVIPDEISDFGSLIAERFT